MQKPNIFRTVRIGLISTALAGATAFTACNDTSNIGGSVVGDDVTIVVDSSFVATGVSVTNDSVLSRTVTALVGTVDAPDYGLLTSSTVAQFMPALKLDTVGIGTHYDRIDSLKLDLSVKLSGFTGDSIAPMGLEVYPLLKQLRLPQYSNFDPAAEGYYDPSQKLASTVYNLTRTNKADSTVLSYHRISLKLPVETARMLYRAYVEHPEYYASPEVFANNVFKGIYLKSSFGSGRVIRVSQTAMTMYYHTVTRIAGTQRDTVIYSKGNYFAVTPEVIANNVINLRIADKLRTRMNAGEHIVVAPAGTDVELTFPAPQIIAAYDKDTKGLRVVNTLAMSLSAEAITNKYNIAPPASLLLVLKRDKKKFFNENKVADNITSFTADYNSVSGTYEFAGMRQYIVDLIAKKEKLDPSDYTFVLTPVNIVTEQQDNGYGSTSTYVTAVNPYIASPAMVKINLEKTKIKFTYSRQTIKN